MNRSGLLRLIGIALVAVTFGSACSPSAETEVRSSGQPTGEQSQRCVAAPRAAEAISRALRLPYGGTLESANAVELVPPVGGYRYVVAAEIDGPDMEGPGQLALWAMSALEDGRIVALNNFAREFSSWDAGPGGASDVRTVSARPEVAVARGCVRQRHGLPS